MESQLISGSDVIDLLLPSVLANINVVGTPDEVNFPHQFEQCYNALPIYVDWSPCWHQCILLLCSAQVVNSWLKCFHSLVPLLDKTLIKAKILPVALAKGANDETSVQSRVICCAMLGSMAACLTKVSQLITACHSFGFTSFDCCFL